MDFTSLAKTFKVLHNFSRIILPQIKPLGVVNEQFQMKKEKKKKDSKKRIFFLSTYFLNYRSS